MPLSPTSTGSAGLHTLEAKRRSTLIGPPTTTAGPAKVLVCHPAPLAGQAIAAALRTRAGVERVAVVASATHLMRELTVPWDVALVSETMGEDLRELLQALAYRGRVLPVVVMTTEATPDVAAAHLEWGAAGSVDIQRPVPALVQAIQVAAGGAPVVDDRVADEIVVRLHERAAHRERTQRILHSLTPRERQVIESLARGTGVTAIAGSLHLSPHTIRACIQTLGPKLHVAGQLQIAAVARELLGAVAQPAPSRYLVRVLATGTGSLQLSS